jgi:hypothetical protein
MLADLDLLLTAVFATADDLLPDRQKNARRRVSDAELVTLAVAQAVMDIASDREFLAVARSRLRHLIAKLPMQPGYWKRRLRLADTIEWLTAMFAQDCPGYFDNIVLLDSTPVECGRSVETARRSELAPACAHHYSRSHSRWFWGMRLHLSRPRTGRREPRSSPQPTRKSATSRCDCLSVACTAASSSSPTRATPAATSKPKPESFGATILRPARKNEPHRGPALSWIRQRIESIFWTLKDRLGLERHRARTLHGLRARIATKLLALAAGVWLNHYLNQPTRGFAALAA